MRNSGISRARKDLSRRKLKTMGDHKAFLSRIKKSLYYGKLPDTERFSLPVSEIAAELFSKIKNGKSLDRLDIEEAAGLSRNACVSPCSFVLALLYLERLKTCNTEYLQRVPPSELFLVSMMIASKFLHDDGEEDEVFNDEWAASAGLDVKEVNRFEKDFLQAIGWEVFVSEEVFWTRLHDLETEIALREGRRRGWFSYSDLDHILETIDLSVVAQTVLSVSAVCLTSYTASVLTLIGSAFIVSQIPGNSISSSISSVANSPLTSTKTLDTANSPLPSPAVVEDIETESIVSSLSSCSQYLSQTELEICNRSPHNKTKLRDSADHWHWYSLLPPDIFNRTSKDNILKRETDVISLLNQFILDTNNGHELSTQFLEWLSWARSLLEIPTVNNIDLNHYWPLEIGVTC